MISSDDKPTRQEIQSYIKQVFSKSGPDGVAWGLRVANCEGGYNPEAYNEGSGTWGMFQFKIGTFLKNSERMGIKNPNIFNWIQQIDVAGWMYSQSQAGQWVCR